MRTLIVGGGPGGLYLALLLKKARPDDDVTVVERNASGVTFGWGVVFSEETMAYLGECDPESAAKISSTFARWDELEVRVRGETVRSAGHRFCGMGRRALLRILEDRCAELGARVLFETPFDVTSDLTKYDLVVAADGLHSALRKRHQDVFRPTLENSSNKYIWFGTNKIFERFTMSFRETPHGIVWVYAYRFDDRTSTFNIECNADAWRGLGLDTADEAKSVAICEELFAADLDGQPLMTNRSLWYDFVTVKNQRWFHENIVLMGDAAHTTHFSTGAGTKLAMEDAATLAKSLAGTRSIPEALATYEKARLPATQRLQNAARESVLWFENVRRYMHFDAPQFAASCLTRSRRISYDNLRVRDPAFGERIDAWFSERAGGPVGPPFLAPYDLGGVKLPNRVVASSHDGHTAHDGLVGDWHLVHLGSRAIGGAGLVIVEGVAVSEDGRVSAGSAGMYRPEHEVAWRRIVDFAHANTSHTRAKMALQLVHAGRRGSTRPPWEAADEPLAEGNWPLLSASALPYKPGLQVPREMTGADFDDVTAAYVRAATMAAGAGFDAIELNFAHGYLLGSFLSPLTNTRKDEHGGALINRSRFPLRVFDAVKAAVPHMPLLVRIAASDWAPGGITHAESLELTRILKEHACDMLIVSSGRTTSDAQPPQGRAFQTPFSDRLRNEARIPTMAIGNITTADEINSILVAGRADLCALGHAHVRDPYWTLHAVSDEARVNALLPREYREPKLS